MTSEFEVEARAAYARFMEEMEDKLQRLEFIAEHRDIELDYTEASLADFEVLFEALLKEAQARDGDTKTVEITCGRYLGEVMRRSHGGDWQLKLDNPKSAHYNQPVIVGHNTFNVPFAPLFLARAYARRLERGMLARAFRGQIAPVKLDLDHLVEQENK